MKLSMLSSAVVLFSMGLVFSADQRADKPIEWYTLVAGPFHPNYHVPKSVFEASKKYFNRDEKIITYGNVLCAEWNQLSHGYTIREIWYQEKEKIDLNDHNKAVVAIELFSDEIVDSFKDEKIDIKKEALDYIKEHKPRGLPKENFKLDTTNVYGHQDKKYEAPREALLLCLLQGTATRFDTLEAVYYRTNEKMSLFCFDEDDIISKVYFPVTDIKLNDEQKKTILIEESQGHAIPQVDLRKQFESKEAALKALRDHINKTHFN